MGRKSTAKLDPKYLTGIPGIDSQHKEIVSMCNTLLKNLEKGNSPDSAYASVEEIMRELKSHCSTEEYLLDMIGFPRAAQHKAQHKKFFAALNRKLKPLKNSECSKTGNFILTLRENLLAHISDYDKKYAVHIENLMALRKKFSITALKARALIE